jgi:hypothetical protein
MNTNFRRNALYGMVLMGKPAIRRVALALTVVATVLPFVVAWFLDIPLWDVFLGVIVATGLSFVFGTAASMAALALGKIEFYMATNDKISLVLGSLSLVLGCSFFVGFSAALLIALTPMLITVPASYALRSWSIDRYGQQYQAQLDDPTN